MAQRPGCVSTCSPAGRTTFLSEPDSGIYDAMNKGLRLVAAPFVLFLNAGDELVDPHALQTLVQRVAEERASWGFGRVEMSATDNLPGSIRPRRVRSYSWVRQAFWRYEIAHPAVVVRTDVLRRMGGFDSSYRIAGDYRVVIALGRCSEPVRVDSLLASMEAGGVSQTDIRTSLMECHRARVETLGLKPPLVWLDSLWSELLILRTRLWRWRAGLGSGLQDSPSEDQVEGNEDEGVQREA